MAKSLLYVLIFWMAKGKAGGTCTNKKMCTSDCLVEMYTKSYGNITK